MWVITGNMNGLENEGNQMRFIRIQKRIPAGHESEVREAGLKGGSGKI